MQQALATMLRMQDRMNTRVHPQWREQDYAWFRAIWVECAELVDHHGYKWWKHYEPDMEQVQLEIVDIWHFGLSDCIAGGSDIDDLAAAIAQQWPSQVADRGVLESAEALASLAAGERRFDIPAFAGLLNAANMSFEELFRQYLGKNVLNFFRQDHGYKDGTYRKTWDGREDNEHLVELLAAIDTAATDAEASLYAALGERYAATALAKRLKLPIQQLFVTLRDYGWIERQGDSWGLTGKGELHGGSYQNSQRFGRYIVWPESLIEHPLLQAIESDQRITPGGMRRYYAHLSTRQISRALAELGLLRNSVQGQVLTPLGKRFGGRQEQSEDHALTLVTWPHEIVDHPVIHRELERLQESGHRVETARAMVDAGAGAADKPSGQPIDDLFAEAPARDGTAASGQQREGADYLALDGHRLSSLLQLRVCDWLYENRLAHACQRALPVEEPLRADFYVPALGLYIECWERDVPTQELTRRLRVREVCREIGLHYQEIAAADMERIDELLTARVLELGHLAC